MASDAKGKGKEIQGLNYNEAQGSHPTNHIQIEPFPAVPNPTITGDNSRLRQADDERTVSDLSEVLRNDPLKVQIKDIIVLANGSGDADALRRAAILNAQFQSVIHASSVDGAHSEDTGCAINKSEYISEHPPLIDSEVASQSSVVDYKSVQNGAKRTISNVSATLNDGMSRISTAETTVFDNVRSPSDCRQEQGIWRFLSRFFCCKTRTMFGVCRPAIRQDSGQQVEVVGAAQKGNVKDKHAAKETRLQPEEASRPLGQSKEGDSTAEEQHRRVNLTA